MALNLGICVSKVSHLEALSFSDKLPYFRGKRQRGQATQMVLEREPATPGLGAGTLVGILGWELFVSVR